MPNLCLSVSSVYHLHFFNIPDILNTTLDKNVSFKNWYAESDDKFICLESIYVVISLLYYNDIINYSINVKCAYRVLISLCSNALLILIIVSIVSRSFAVISCFLIAK